MMQAANTQRDRKDGPYIVGFSGPPGSGKDSTAKVLAEKLRLQTTMPVEVVSLTAPLRDIATRVFGLDKMASGAEELRALYEKYKDVKREEFRGDSIRRFMIELSERFMKPRYGKAIWAQLMLDAFSPKRPRILLVTDLGFLEEVEFFQQWTYAEKVACVELERAGCDWAGDSRNYIPKRFWFHSAVDDEEVWNIRRFQNDRDIESLALKILDWLNEELRWDIVDFDRYPI